MQEVAQWYASHWSASDAARVAPGDRGMANNPSDSCSRKTRKRRRLWFWVLPAILLQVALLALAALLLDLFAHDLLCRYHMARWDPDERTCYRQEPGLGRQ